MQQSHCLLPPGSPAVYCRSSTAHCPQAVMQSIVGVAVPTAPRQRSSAVQKERDLHCPLPPSSEAVFNKGSAAHCPRAVRQCIAGIALPSAPKQ